MSSPTKTRRLPAWAGSSIPPHVQSIGFKSSKEISQQQQSASSQQQSEDITENSSSPNPADVVPKCLEIGTKQTVKDFSKLMEGVIVSISGIVNPERTELRKMALDMGAQYRPSWSIDSTLLVCPFVNTPTFKQVQASGGTVVHKDWITKCYNQKELVAIEMYLLHVGKPWKTASTLDESIDFCVVTDIADSKSCEDVHTSSVKSTRESQTNIPPRKLSKLHGNPGGAGLEYQPNQRGGALKNLASPVDVQQWVLEDLAATLTWLEQQNDKPEENELEAIAAQGLLVCLEDAVRSLKANKGLSMVMDNWAFIPRAVRELAVYEKGGQAIKDQLIAEGERFKVIYESQLKKLGFGVPALRNDERRAIKSGQDEKDAIVESSKTGPIEETEKDVDDDATEIISDTDSRDPADFDTDDTEELNEDELARCKDKILQTFRVD
ncbi:unnamed protein product [Calypogeia fissa]